MASLTFKVVGVLMLSLRLTNQSLAPVFSNLKFCPRNIQNNFSIMISLLLNLLLVSCSLGNDFSCLGLSSLLCKSLLILSCNDGDRLSFISVDLIYHHTRFTFNLSSVILDLSHILCMIDLKQLLHIVPSEL